MTDLGTGLHGIEEVDARRLASETPDIAAERYWRITSALAASHLLGRTWPPPGRPQRSRVIGHWGCNPGIAWTVGHLAARWKGAGPFQLVVGTGHAASFMFAHRAVSGGLDGAAISSATADYGAAGGTPSEILGLPNVPYYGGELGPGLGVSQGLAAHHGADGAVICVIGDGECETPQALAALAHADVLLDRGAIWLPVINANGARMGGPTRFDRDGLVNALRGLGYEVLVSGDERVEASEAAAAALAGCLAGKRSVWVSVTEKGWPAPAEIAGRPYRGHFAHKAPPAAHQGLRADEVARWFDAFGVTELLESDGALPGDVIRLARRASLEAVAPAWRPGVSRSLPAGHRSTSEAWDRPMARVDDVLVDRRVVVYCPDEASSNGLRGSLAAGLVTEVLAEDLCAAWTWGTVEAGQPAALVTYEAFAPIAASTLAQYTKMTQVRPPRGVPPFVVLSTSLGWANTPTHQCTDLTGILLARSFSPPEVVYPVGGTSAAGRLASLLDERSDGVALLVCSKQPLLDLPDTGQPVMRYRIAGAGDPAALIVTVGDVCATEAVAAAALAAPFGHAIDVIALVDLRRAAAALRPEAERLQDLPVMGAAWCAPRYIQPIVWEALGRIVPIQGYVERWAAVAWETLQANRLDRVSLLEDLAREGLPLPGAVLEAARAELRERFETASDLAGVLRFEAPALDVKGIGA